MNDRGYLYFSLYVTNNQDFNSEKKKNSGSIQNPTSRAIYKETNCLVEKWCEIIYFVCVKVLLPIAMAPKAIICYFMYFIMDAGSDAFALPFAAWYVL